MSQAALDFTPARAKGERMAGLCQEKAERVASFDSAGAAAFMLAHLIEHGPTSGEQLVILAKAAGFIGHDDRCYGGVFKGLADRDEILCLRSDLPRARGHGTSGGKLWAAVE